MKETGIPDKLAKDHFPRKPPGAPSGYYLWKGSIESRRCAAREWIKALEEYIESLDDIR